MKQTGTDRGLERRIKQHVNAGKHAFFAIVQPGFEETARGELMETGVEEFTETVEGGIEFTGDLDSCYRCNIRSRTMSRLIMRITGFRARTFHTFHRGMETIPWELYISHNRELSFGIACRHSRLYHTGRLEEEAADAMGKRLGLYGKSPASGKGHDSQTIFVRIEDDSCLISLDTSGDNLYKRSGEKFVTPATIRETIAACILREAGLEQYDVLIDPMCGSGTFSTEAGGIFLKRHPGLERSFPFMRWPAFREPAYKHLKKNLAADMIRPEDCGKKIIASDIDPEAVKAAAANINAAGAGGITSCETRDFLREPVRVEAGKKHLIVLNPPYGSRLGSGNTEKLYRRIGTVIRKNYGNCGYAVIVPGIENEKILSLPYDRKILFMNGGIRVAVLFRDIRPSSL